MRPVAALIVALALLSNSPAYGQYSGSGYSSRSDSSSSGSSTRISGRAIGKLVGLVVAGFIALCSFIWRAATGSGGNSGTAASVRQKGSPPDFSALGSPPTQPPDQETPRNFG